MPLNTISEICRKYLIEVSYKGRSYLTVSGVDLEDEDENMPDKVLVNGYGKFVLAQDLNSLQSFINSNSVFDKDNFLKWMRRFPLEPYAKSNFDILLTETDVYEQKTFEEIVNVVLMIKDYALQTENEALLTLIDHVEVSEYIDLWYNMYFWSKEYETKAADFKDHMPNYFKTIYTLMESYIDIILVPE